MSIPYNLKFITTKSGIRVAILANPIYIDNPLLAGFNFIEKYRLFVHREDVAFGIGLETSFNGIRWKRLFNRYERAIETIRSYNKELSVAVYEFGKIEYAKNSPMYIPDYICIESIMHIITSFHRSVNYMTALQFRVTINNEIIPYIEKNFDKIFIK